MNLIIKVRGEKVVFFDTLNKSITGKPNKITKPIFVESQCSAQSQIEKMKELKEVAPYEVSKQIEQDIKILSYGISGENSIAYELKHSYMPILVLRDLYLKYESLTAQIDFVVINTKFILVIECKKMVGDIEITRDGSFIRSFKNSGGRVYKKEGIYSPIVQNERHIELIKRILRSKLDFRDKDFKDLLHSIIVFANEKTILNMKYAEPQVKEAIIRSDQLVKHMKNLGSSSGWNYISEKGLYRVAEAILSYHEENTVDYTQKYNLDSSAIPRENEEEKPQVSEELMLPIEETPIYKELREYRLSRSREDGIKPYWVYSNAQLEQIITLMPESHKEIKQIKGFAEVKCSKYGDAIINIVKKHKQKL